jgi:hypothetical protein
MGLTNTRQVISPCGLVVAYFALGQEFGFFPMNSRTLWIALLVGIIAMWILFLVAGSLLQWGGWRRILASLVFLEREKGATCSCPCANDDDSVSKWRDQVRSNWPQNDVEKAIEMILPTRPDNVYGRRHTFSDDDSTLASYCYLTRSTDLHNTASCSTLL